AIGRPMGELAARGSRIAVSDEAFTQRGAARRRHDGGDTDEVGRPALGLDERARQAEGKIEDAEPGAGAREEGVEADEVGDAFDPLEAQPAAAGTSGCHDDGLASRGRRGEVDAMEQRRLERVVGCRDAGGVNARPPWCGAAQGSTTTSV